MHKILLVDDEPGILKVFGIVLADRGYQVATAESGESALEIFRKDQPDIVITDIKMPGMDGIELLKKIKQEKQSVEVIMITGHGDMELAIQSLKFEAADFITKPIHDDALEIVLKRVCEKIQYKRQLKEYTENLEKLVKEKTRELLQAERLATIGETVAGLAHAIKNMASGLTGGMYVLGKGIELDNKQYLAEGWEMVKRNIDKIKNLALELLNYTKVREPHYERCDPNRLAYDAVDSMKAYAEKNGVELKLECDQNIPEGFLDSEGIHRVLLNLIGNAVDACIELQLECGDHRKQVSLKTWKPRGWAVAYAITDTGCGMSMEIKRNIFQRFFSTKGSQGTGLGLMIAKKIVDEHRGEIEIESEAGKGSCFTVKLPDKIMEINENRV